MDRANLINRLNNQFGLNATTADEFYGRVTDGIWVRNEGKVMPGDMPAFDSNATEYDPNEELYRMGVALEVDEVLTDAGWYAEPYDSGTWMIWPQ